MLYVIRAVARYKLPFFLSCAAFFLISCQKTPESPASLSRTIAEALLHHDPKASGVFFEGSNQLDDQHLVVIYSIGCLDDPDDPWAHKREVQFLFRPAPEDPNAPGGWYLERIMGDYLEHLGVSEGMQFDWEYRFYQTKDGTRHGIVGLAGMKRAR